MLRFWLRGLRAAAPGVAIAWLCLSLAETAMSAGAISLASVYSAGVLGCCFLIALVLYASAVAPVLARFGARPPAPLRPVLLGALVALLVAVPAYFVLHAVAEARFKRAWAFMDMLQRLIAAYGAAAIGALASLVFFWFTQRRRVAYPRYLWAALFLPALVATHTDFSAFAGGREAWLMLGAVAVLTLALAGARPPVRARAACEALFAAMLACIALLVVSVGSRPVARGELVRHHDGTAELLRRGLAHFDFDGDGYPAAFGGSDCNDADPGVGPEALEFAGNGIDDNCIGGDFPLSRRRARPSALRAHRRAT